MASKLTDAVIKALPAPAKGSRIFYDEAVKGFGIRVTANGARAFVLNYRTRLGRERRDTIGTFPDWRTGPARTEALDLKKRIDQGGDPLGEIKAGRAAPTVNDLCDRFIAEYLPRKRPTTRKGYTQQIDADIRPGLGRLRVAEVSFADVDALHRSISRRAPYHANRVLAVLSRMFAMAIKWRMRTDSPCRGVERNPEHQRRRYLSADELVRLAAVLATTDQQIADIIRLLLLTGARRGEVLQARWTDIDLKTGIWSKPALATKQGTAHTVPLSEAAQRVLHSVRERQAGSEWVFPAADGSHRCNIHNGWFRICKAADITGARVHDLRHTYASVLASAGLSLPVIGALLGHSNPTTTARYSHLFDDPLRRQLSAPPTSSPAPLAPKSFRWIAEAVKCRAMFHRCHFVFG
jgi:integrase